MSYIHMIEHHMAIKRNEALIYATAGMNLRNRMTLSETSQSIDNILYDSIYVSETEKANL